jgi:hypothetical protein
MSEGPFPKTIREAIPCFTWGAVIFTFFLVFVEKLVEQAFGQALAALVGGLVVAAMALHSGVWLQRTNPNWAFAAALALLFAVISMPWVEQKRWPFSAWFQDNAAIEAQNSTLIEWLQQAQRERDEAKQRAAEAEAQKATLIERLQTAQGGAGKARPAELNYPVRTQIPNPAVCADLLRLRSNVSSPELKKHEWNVFQDHPLEEDVRSVMKNLGCLSD